MLAVWSAKAGAGCTTISLGAAGVLARRHGACLLIDLGGDVPAALGITEPAAGVTDWLAMDTHDAEAFGRLERDGGAAGLDVVALGSALDWPERADEELLCVIESSGRPAVIDVGDITSSRSAALTRLRTRVAKRASSAFVTRAGYLEVRHGLRADVGDSRIVLVRENGRALNRYDLARILGAQIAVEVDVDPRVARATDNGTLLRRAPKTFDRAVAAIVS